MHAVVSEPCDNIMETPEVATADDEMIPGDTSFELTSTEDTEQSHNYIHSRLRESSNSPDNQLIIDFGRSPIELEAQQEAQDGTSNTESLKLEQDSHFSNLDSDRSENSLKCAKIPRLSETPSPAASLPLPIDIIGSSISGAASWHPHVYARPPRAPTPHFIADILGWGKDAKSRIVNDEIVSLDSEPLNLSVAKSCNPKSRIALKKGEFFKIIINIIFM